MAEPRLVEVEPLVRVERALAYLVPALLAGERVIVSTGTRTLQDQLYHRDLPGGSGRGCWCACRWGGRRSWGS